MTTRTLAGSKRRRELLAQPTLTISEASELLGRSEWIIRRGIDDGSVPAIRMGSKLLYVVTADFAEKFRIR
jgi:excisionase family DNA binding protein